jgi:hypothetical protein
VVLQSPAWVSTVQAVVLTAATLLAGGLDHVHDSYDGKRKKSGEAQHRAPEHGLAGMEKCESDDQHAEQKHSCEDW